MEYKNSKIKISVITPYKQRLNNIKLMFETLSNQTMDKSEFEVIVGTMEYCEDYVAVCKEFSDKINIHTVISYEEFRVGAARNLALRNAVGEIILLLDADMIIGQDFLENLYEKHFSYNQKQCVIGQMINYDNNTSDVTSVKLEPFSYYETRLNELKNKENMEIDQRLKVSYNIPWAFAWTAILALPRKLLEENQLYFDSNFKGYGVEDLEWAYRLCYAGIPIIMKKDVWGIHLPHVRDLNNNKISERLNYRYFLKKWPGIDVELACAFGDFESNGIYPDFKNEVLDITHNKYSKFYILTGKVKGVLTIVIGAVRNEDGSFVNANSIPQFDINSETEILPIVGLSLPYEDKYFETCKILSSIKAFTSQYRDIILKECKRVSTTESIEE